LIQCHSVCHKTHMDLAYCPSALNTTDWPCFAKSLPSFLVVLSSVKCPAK